jgi:hypothetical protein
MLYVDFRMFSKHTARTVCFVMYRRHTSARQQLAEV